MLASFLSVASAVTGVFLVMSMGGLARHWKWFTSEVDKSLAGFTSNVLMPSLFFSRIMSDSRLSMHWDAWLPALYGFFGTAASLLFARSMVAIAGPWFGVRSDSQKRTFSLCTGINNYGYLPLPLADVFFPACVVPLMIHNVGVDLALWSVGLYIISGAGIKNSWKRIVFSPPLISVGVAVVLRQTGWNAWVPEPFMYMCQQLGRCSVPMALVLGGAIIYDYAGRLQIATAWRPFVFALFLRLFLLPLFLLALARWTTDTDELKQVLLLQASMPAGTFPIVMTRLYNQDVETAWIVVVGTSLVGLLSIPIWMAIATQFLGFG